MNRVKVAVTDSGDIFTLVSIYNQSKQRTQIQRLQLNICSASIIMRIILPIPLVLAQTCKDKTISTHIPTFKSPVSLVIKRMCVVL